MAFSKAREYLQSTPRSKLEKKLVFKLDFFILTFCCLAYFMNYLDRSNITNAYVSGMKEDLNFKGAQLTVINTIYSCGYLLGIIPNNMLLTYFKPRVFFPTTMTIWAAFTMCTAAVKTPQQIMAIRFFQGYAESCVFAGTHFLLGSWYTEKELGKRSGLFTSSGLAGGMFGGFLQTGIHSSMNGLAGLSGWRWLFIIDGIITLPIALYGFLFFPDTPAKTAAPYLSLEERQLASTRVPPVTGSPILEVSFFKKVFASWYFYAFGLLWIISNCSEGQSSQSLLSLYMKSHPTIKYSVGQLDNYPTGVQAVGIVSTLLWACATDIWGKRWLCGYYIAVTAVVSAIILLIPSTSTAGHFGAYYWAGSIYACQGTFFAWANDTLRHEPATYRAVIIGCMNFGGNMFQVWWPLIFFRADDAPKFTRGNSAMIGIGIAMAIWVTVMLYMERRLKNRQVIDAVESVDVVEESTSFDKTISKV